MRKFAMIAALGLLVCGTFAATQAQAQSLFGPAEGPVLIPPVYTPGPSAPLVCVQTKRGLICGHGLVTSF